MEITQNFVIRSEKAKESRFKAPQSSIYALILCFIFFRFIMSAKRMKGDASFLSNVETKIFLSFVKKTYVRNCIMAPKEISDETAVKFIKTLSEDQVFTVFLERKNLKKYLEKIDSKVYRVTAIVLKEESLKSLDYFNNKDIISSYFWLLFDGSNGTLRYDLLQTEIPFDAGLLLIEKIKRDNYILSEYYNIKKFVPGILEIIAKWNNNSLTSVEKEWYDRKSNMHKYEFITVKFKENLYLAPKEKLNEAIWQELSELLNFTIKLKVIKYYPNREIETLDSEEEALLDTQIYIGDNKRFKYLLGPTSRSGLYMHVKAEGEHEGLTRFLKPFSKETWLNIVCWICYCGIFDFLIEYVSRRFICSEQGRGMSKESFQNIFTPLDSLCNQSGVQISNNLASRFVLFLIRTSAVIINYAYAATFISYLLLYIPQLPFTDLKGFVEDGTYKIIAERNSDVDTFFNVSVQPLEKLVFNKFLFNISKWSRLDTEIDRVCKNEKLVLVAYDDDVDGYRPCNIVKIRKPLKIFANGFKIRFKSPFRGLLHIKLLLLRTTGILEKINKQIFYKYKRKFNMKESYEISMGKVWAIFKFFYYGCLLSIVLLAFEIIFRKVVVSLQDGRKHTAPINRILTQKKFPKKGRKV